MAAGKGRGKGRECGKKMLERRGKGRQGEDRGREGRKKKRRERRREERGREIMEGERMEGLRRGVVYRERERCRAGSLRCKNSWGSSRLMPDLWNSILVSHRMLTTQATFCCFPRYVSRELDTKQSSQCSDMGCLSHV